MSIDAKQTMTDFPCWQHLATYGPMSTPSTTLLDFSCPLASRGSNVGWRSAAHWSPASGMRRTALWRHLATSGDIWRPALAFSAFHDPSYAKPHTRSTCAIQHESGNGQYMAVLQSPSHTSRKSMHILSRNYLPLSVTPRHTASWC